MRIRLAAVVLFSALLISGRAYAQVPPETTHGELTANFWTPTPELSLEGVEFVDRLGIENKRFVEYRALLKPGRKHKLRFSYVQVKYDELGKVIDTTFVFRGRTYNVNLPVNYEFKWDLYRFGYEWDFLTFDRGFVGVIAELKYNKVTATVVSPVGGTATEDVKAPIPTIGGIARGYLGDYVSVTGEFTGLKITRDDFRGRFYDFDIYAQVNLNKYLAAQVGYRAVDVDYLVDASTGGCPSSC